MHRSDADPREAFSAALRALRELARDSPDDAVARLASSVRSPAGRQVRVDPRRLGEWLAGTAVPRSFEPIAALVRALHPGPGAEQALPGWRQLWRSAAAAPQRALPDTRGTAADRPLTGSEERPRLVVVGRPPGRAVGFRRRLPLADRLDAALGDPGVSRVLVTGLGGVGKSQLAAAALDQARRRGELDLLAWIPAVSRGSVLASYARAWRALVASGTTGDLAAGPVPAEDEVTADLFLAWARGSRVRWFVVLDDVRDPADLRGLWPEGNGRTVVTSQRRDAALQAGAQVVEVGPFDEQEAIDFLGDRLGPWTARAAHVPREDSRQLVRALGCHPLAVAQAAAVMLDGGISVAGYLADITSRRQCLTALLPAGSSGDDHSGSVADTWAVGVARADELAVPGAARGLLEFLALLSGDGVPEQLLFGDAACRWVGGRVEPPVERVPEQVIRSAVRALHRVNLATHDPVLGGEVRVHGLVQRAALDALPQVDRDRLAVLVADALEDCWQARRGLADAGTRALLHQNVEVLRRAEGGRLWIGGMHPVLRRIGPYLSDLGLGGAAHQALVELARDAQVALGPDHPDVLVTQAQLAHAMSDHLGEGEAGEALIDDAWQRATAANPRDPRILELRILRASLKGWLHGSARVLAEAEQVLADLVAELGELHPLTIRGADTAARTRGLSGDPVGAAARLRDLADRLAVALGTDHRDCLMIRNELARWTAEAGDLDEAVRLLTHLQQTLADTLGPDHYETLACANNLGTCQGRAGDHAGAVATLTPATLLATRSMGGESPTALTIRVNLVHWRGRLEDPTRAVRELDGFIADLERIFGPEHLRTVIARRMRAEHRAAAGDPAGALAELDHLEEVVRQRFGTSHLQLSEIQQLRGHIAADPPAPDRPLASTRR